MQENTKTTEKPRILVLSSAETDEYIPLNDAFIEQLRNSLDERAEIEWHNYHDIRIDFRQGSTKVWLAESGMELKEFDFVYYKSFFRYSELAGVIAAYLDRNNVKYVCSELRGHIPLTKLSQLSRLSLANLPIARTVFMLHDQWASEFSRISNSLKIPFIFKSTDGSAGDENYLIRSEEEFHAALVAYPDLEFVAQEFIENDSDLRVLIMGAEIKLIIKRQRTDPAITHLNNTSQGANAFLVPVGELNAKHQEIALRAAEVMDREIAGVDLLFELESGQPYILEVNASPQIASGTFTEEKLALYSDYFVKAAREGQLHKNAINVENIA